MEKNVFGRSWSRLIVGALLAILLAARPGAAEWSSSPEAAQIVMVVSQLLEKYHFSGQPLDDAVSEKFLQSYLDKLDYNHLFLLRTDEERFQKYATTLDNSLLMGNLRPAFEIYDCYSNRVEQCVAMVNQLLEGPVSFEADEFFRLDRHELPRPADETEQRELLRQRVKFELLEERLNKETPEEARRIVSRRYERLRRMVHEADTETVLELYLNALTESYDPHSQYMSPSTEDNFNIDMKLSLTGIGAVLRSEDGYAKIVSLVPGGPADLDKRLKPNDRIVAVAQGDGPWVDVVDMRLNKVVELIRGRKGSVVRLRVIPADAPDSSSRTEISLTRDEIKLTAQEAKAKVVELNGEGDVPLRLGYLELPSFYLDLKNGPESKSSARDVAKLLGKLKAEGIEGLLVDLRRNTGGSLSEAVALTGLFIPEGPVVQVRNGEKKVRVLRDEDPSVAYDGPLVVLVSHLSASASEILAAALQDHKRAVIVGDQRTFGKGTVQQVWDLDQIVAFKRHKAGSLGALKLTIQKFYRVSGGSTQAEGVVPDLLLPSVLDARKIGETALPNRLPYDEIAAVGFHKQDCVSPYLDEIRARSSARVSRDPEFAYIREDFDRLRKQIEEKVVSLNEKRRLAEKQAITERLEARKKERETRATAPLKMIEIALGGGGETTTNRVTVVARVTPMAAADPGAEVAAEHPERTVDPLVHESLHILSDYVVLSRKGTGS